METYFNGFMTAIRTSVLEGSSTLYVLDSGDFQTHVVRNVSITFREPFRYGELSLTTSSTDLISMLSHRMTLVGVSYELYLPFDSSEGNREFYHLERCFPSSISTTWDAAQDLSYEIDLRFNSLTTLRNFEAAQISRRAVAVREMTAESVKICWKKYGF